MSIGTPVSFAVFLNKDLKPQAFDVMPIDSAVKAGKCNKADGFKGKAPTMQAPNTWSDGISFSNKGWETSTAFQWGKAGGRLDYYPEEFTSCAWDSTWGKGKISKIGYDEATYGFGKGFGKGYGDNFGGSWSSGYSKGSFDDCAWSVQSMPPAKRHHSAEQSPRARGADEKEQLGEYCGTIKSFGAGKAAYGFIECPALKAIGFANDVFLHQEQYNGRSLAVGDTCVFEVFLNSSGKPQAKNLKPSTAVAEQVAWESSGAEAHAF